MGNREGGADSVGCTTRTNAFARKGGGRSTAEELPVYVMWPASPTPALRLGTPRTHIRNCGGQPAHQSLITDVYRPCLLPCAPIPATVTAANECWRVIPSLKTDIRTLAQAGREQIMEEQPDVDGNGQQLELHGLLARLQLDAAALPGKAAVATLGSMAAHDSRPAPQRPGAGHPATSDTGQRAGGRPPKLSFERRVKIAEEVLSGRGTAAGVARRYGVREATISRLLAASWMGAVVPSASGQARKDTAHADLIAGVLPVSALDERLAIVGTSGCGASYRS